MELRIVFTRNDKSFISRAIQWFTQRKTNPERRCSHVVVKFEPCGGVFGEVSPWWAFEAMERGVWVSSFDKSLGSQTIVGEFRLNVPSSTANSVMKEALEKYNDLFYDFAGIGLWAYWVLAKKVFGTPIRLLNLVFRPGKTDKALFCSGLAFHVVRMVSEIETGVDWGVGHLTARTSTPRNLIDIFFDRPRLYEVVNEIEGDSER